MEELLVYYVHCIKYRFKTMLYSYIIFVNILGKQFIKNDSLCLAGSTTSTTPPYFSRPHPQKAGQATVPAPPPPATQDCTYRVFKAPPG